MFRQLSKRRRASKISLYFAQPYNFERLLYYLSDCNHAEIKAMFEWIEAKPELGRVDFCFANAGMGSKDGMLDGNFHKVNILKRLMER